MTLKDEQPKLFFTQLPTQFLYRGKLMTREELLAIGIAEEHPIMCVHSSRSAESCPSCAALKQEIELAKQELERAKKE